MYDLIVVGAGPTGSTAAKFAASKGLKVIVFEQYRLDREKPCGGVVSERAIQEFRIPERVFSGFLYGFALCSPKCFYTEVDFPFRVGGLAMRSNLDSALAMLAMDEGAEFEEETRVLEPIMKDGAVKGVRVRKRGGIVECFSRATIVADGTPSTVARRLNLFTGNPEAMGITCQYQMRMPEEVVEERIGNRAEVYLGDEVAPKGEAWIIPKGEIVSVGVGTRLSTAMKDEIKLKQRLDLFIKNHPVASKKLKGAKTLYSQRHLIGLRGPKGKVVSRIYGDGFIIAGDAGGFVDPAVGAGIHPGMESGRISSEVIVEALEKNDTSATKLKEYEDKVGALQTDFDKGWRLRKLFFEKEIGQEWIIRMMDEFKDDSKLARPLKDQVSYDYTLKLLAKSPHKLLLVFIKSLI